MRRIVRGWVLMIGCIGSAPLAHGLLPLAPTKASTIPAGSVLCGIDSIFYDGFEPASFIPAAQAPGGLSSPGLATDIVGSGALSVAITSPASGVTTGDSTVDVIGTFSGPVNTGITVNNVAGYGVDGSFLVPNVALNPGGNTLTVQATTLPGTTATASVSVTRSGSPSSVVLRADRSTGYAPLALNFTYGVGTLPDNGAVEAVTVNFKGSGADDYSGPLSGAPAQHTYARPGVYTARFTVTDNHQQTYTAYRAVLIQDLTAQRGMLCDVYGYLGNRLTAQDAVGAGNAFQPVQRNHYVSFFTQLGANMPATAAQLGVIVSGQLGLGFADLLLVRDDVATQTRNGFPLRMTQGTDGVWRISEM